MTLARSSAVALLICLLPACGTDPIEMSGDPAAIPPFKSFRIADEQLVFASEVSDEQRDKVSKQLRGAAASALEKRGYREATDADVLVDLAAMSRPTLSDAAGAGSTFSHVDPTVLDSSRSVTSPASEVPPSGVGREGDLLMSLRDAKTGKALWSASSYGAASSPSEALRKARSTYAAMAAKLPKAGSGSTHE
jgi:hypothetical protein